MSCCNVLKFRNALCKATLSEWQVCFLIDCASFVSENEGEIYYMHAKLLVDYVHL